MSETPIRCEWRGMAGDPLYERYHDTGRKEELTTPHGPVVVRTHTPHHSGSSSTRRNWIG